MADVESTQPGEVWPKSQFNFQVQWGTDVLSFQEVSGLDLETSSIEYRHGDDPAFSKINMPGMDKSGTVTLKRGLFTGEHTFWDWFNQIKMNTVKRVPVTITLFDETGAPLMVWTLANAWPTKITGTDMKSQSNEVAIESIEIAHEGIAIASA